MLSLIAGHLFFLSRFVLIGCSLQLIKLYIYNQTTYNSGYNRTARRTELQSGFAQASGMHEWRGGRMGGGEWGRGAAETTRREKKEEGAARPWHRPSLRV